MSDVERIAQTATLEDFDLAMSITTDRRYQTAIEAANLLHDYYVDALAALARRDAAIQAVRDMLAELVADKRSLWVSSDSIRSVIEYAAIAAEMEKTDGC